MTDTTGKTVGQIMSPIKDIDEEASLTDALLRFENSGVSGLPVKNSKGIYVGVISKTDIAGSKLIACMNNGMKPDDIKVKLFMNPNPPIALEEDETIRNAVDTMLARRVHRLFVQDRHGKLTGVISTFDIVRLMQQVFAGRE